MGQLQVDCDVPFVLDASRTSDALYMAGHFADLVQEWGITGVIDGVNITAFIEKMYFGSHAPDEPVLSLTQSSMQDIFTPRYAVKIDFMPDEAVTAGSVWEVGIDEDEAVGVLMRHQGPAELCLFSIAYAGSLSFLSAVDVTRIEGGSFSVEGTMEMGAPADLPGMCDLFESTGIPCCE